MAEANRVVKINESTAPTGTYIIGNGQVQAITGASISGASNLAWDSAGHTITRTGGSWLTDGFRAGMQINVSDADTAGNDGTHLVAHVTALVLTLVSTSVITTDATDTGAAANGKVVSGLVASNYSGVAVAGHDIFVADVAKHVVYKGNSNGNFVVIAGLLDTAGHVDGALGTNRLTSPAALAVDSSRNIWVVQTGGTGSITGAHPTASIAGAHLTGTIAGASNIAWVDTASPTLTRTGGSWITDGFKAGMILTVTSSDTPANNGTYTIFSVAATVLTLIAANSVTADPTDTGAAANGAITAESVLVWANTASPTITRTEGSWITDGFVAGMVITVEDATTGANDGTYTVASRTATVLTLIETDSVTADAADAGAAVNAKITGEGVLVWADTTPPTITRGVGSWITDGFTVGTITVTNADEAANDGTFEVTGVTATVLTLGMNDTVVADDYDDGAAVNASITGNSNCIRKIDFNGNLHTIVGLPTSTDGSIAVDASGHVWMVDNTTV